MGKENRRQDGISDSVNQGIVRLTALCPYITTICYHIMAIYRYLPFFASTVTTKTENYLVKTKYS
jgi:hypothetical protein